MLIIPTAFDFSDEIVTNLEAGLPPGVEPFFEMGDNDLDSDYNDPIGAPVKIQAPIDAAAAILLGRTMKAYIVKYTAYRRFVDDS
jgi:hypothetical protein